MNLRSSGLNQGEHFKILWSFSCSLWDAISKRAFILQKLNCFVIWPSNSLCWLVVVQNFWHTVELFRSQIYADWFIHVWEAEKKSFETHSLSCNSRVHDQNISSFWPLRTLLLLPISPSTVITLFVVSHLRLEELCKSKYGIWGKMNRATIFMSCELSRFPSIVSKAEGGQMRTGGTCTRTQS